MNTAHSRYCLYGQNKIPLSVVPISFDGWWLRTRGLAHRITTYCGYTVGMGAMMESVIFVPNLVRNLGPLRFAQTNSTDNGHFSPLEGKKRFFSTKSSFWTKVTTTQPYRSESWNPLGLKLMRCFSCRLPPQIFSKMTKIGFKIPPILVDKFLKAVFNVYRNPRVQTELAEAFTIARTFNSLKNFTRRPALISLGARNRGISKKTVIF